MPEGAHAYPRWEGPMRTGGATFVVAGQEIKRAANNVLIWVVIGLFAVVQLVYTRSQEHTMVNYVKFVDNLRWVALAVGAIMSGPAFLDDQRKGALELYLARAVTTRDYLWGKVLAVFAVCTGLMWLPALTTYLFSFVSFDAHPAHWNLAPWAALGYSLFWGALVTATGLGLSCVARSAIAASILLFATFTVLHIFFSTALQNITKEKLLAIISPFAALKQQTSWLFPDTPEPYAFPVWWGILEWAALVATGLILVAWRHPRVRGDEPVSA